MDKIKVELTLSEIFEIRFCLNHTVNTLFIGSDYLLRKSPLELFDKLGAIKDEACKKGAKA